jgi:hypothetical protein
MTETWASQTVVVLADAGASSLVITLPQLLSVFLMVGGILTLVWAFKGRLDAKGDEASRRGAAAPAWSRADAAERLERSVREARELSAILDDQVDQAAQRLDRLIAAAQERVIRLERLERTGDYAGGPGGRIGPPPVDPLNQTVYQLADEGLPPVEIARKLQQHTGKVELILALRKR